MGRNKYRSRHVKGASLAEVLVSIVILGFIAAAVTQALLANTSYFSVLQNRVDNGMAVRLFARRLTRDVRQSWQVGFGNADSSSSSRLVLYKPPKTNFDSNGFFHTPTLMNDCQITYIVVPDDTPGFFKIDCITPTDRQTVLHGILGPLAKDQSAIPKIFQYISRQDAPASDFATTLTRGVILNLELRRTDYGSDTGTFHAVKTTARQKSALVFHTEIMLRNSVL